MPHVRLKGEIDLRAVWQEPPAFSFSVPEDDTHVKFREAFLASNGEVLLLRFVVAEGRLVQHVQLLLIKEPSTFLLKIDRGTPVLKSPGVKLLLATVAGWLCARGAAVASTNLQSFIVRGAFYAVHAQTRGKGAKSEPIDGD
jgi:hypothetical protein